MCFPAESNSWGSAARRSTPPVPIKPILSAFAMRQHPEMQQQEAARPQGREGIRTLSWQFSNNPHHSSVHGRQRFFEDLLRNVATKGRETCTSRCMFSTETCLLRTLLSYHVHEEGPKVFARHLLSLCRVFQCLDRRLKRNPGVKADHNNGSFHHSEVHGATPRRT